MSESLSRLKRRLRKEAAKKILEQVAEASKRKRSGREAEMERKPAQDLLRPIHTPFNINSWLHIFIPIINNFKVILRCVEA